jgi:signal transduction histidine kinase
MSAPLPIPNEELLQRAETVVRQDPSQVADLLAPIISAPDATPIDMTRALLLMARAAIFTGHEQGEAYAEAALDTARIHGLRRYEGLAHNEKGIFRFIRADFEGALGHYAIAEQLLRDHGTEIDLAKVYLNSGNVYHRTHDETLAIDMYEKVAQIAARTGDALLEAKVSTNMAGMYGNVLHDVDTAIRYARRAIVLYEGVNDRVGLAKAYVNVAHYLRVKEQLDEAREYYEAAITTRSGNFEPADFFTNYQGLILTHLLRQDTVAAREMLEFVYASPYGQQRLPGIEYIREVEATLLYQEGRYDEALAIIDEVERFVEEHHYEEMRDYLLGTKVECLRKVGRLDEALDTLQLLFQEQMRDTRRRAEYRLVKMRSHYDLIQAQAAAEVERLRNVELAAALDEARRLHQKNDEYLAFMAHELKSPLTSIRSIARLLASDPSIDTDERMSLSKEVFDVSTRMFDHITQVLERGRDRSESDGPSIVNVTSVWQHVVGLWRHRIAEKRIALTTVMLEREIMVEGNEGALVSILDNLISNAVKFSPVGSSIEVITRGIPTMKEPTSVILSVRDEGPGLTAADLTRLFTAYGRLSAEPTSGEDSTGLGLLIVKRETEALRGRVWCESIAGQGATFFVELPIARQQVLGQSLESGV